MKERRTDSSVIEESTPYLRLEVTDNGIGIGQADQQRLFQPFFQIDGKLTRQYEGTGLGLALTKRLAELHGGVASVESEIGTGSSFRVWLPLTLSESDSQLLGEEMSAASTRPKVSEPMQVEDEAALTQPLILVVEDKPFNQTLIKEILVMQNYQVDIVDDGMAMEERITMGDRLPDLILMDIQLPYVDGLTLTRQLKASPQWQGIPIIVITALLWQAIVNNVWQQEPTIISVSRYR